MEMTATANHALQRTAPGVTLAAADHPAAFARPAPSHLRPQPARRPPQSLSLGSLGVIPMRSLITVFVALLLSISATLHAKDPLEGSWVFVGTDLEKPSKEESAMIWTFRDGKIQWEPDDPSGNPQIGYSGRYVLDESTTPTRID